MDPRGMEQTPSEIQKEIMAEALGVYQRMMGLPTTGTLNALTMEMMRSPRCGNKDLDIRPTSRKKRYALSGDPLPPSGVEELNFINSTISNKGFNVYYCEG